MTAPTDRSPRFARRYPDHRRADHTPEGAGFVREVIPERDRVRVAPNGELDIATTPRLEASVRELREAGFDHIILDLGQLSFIDCAGLRPILALDAAARADWLRLQLLPGPPGVQRILEITGRASRSGVHRVRARGRRSGAGPGWAGEVAVFEAVAARGARVGAAADDEGVEHAGSARPVPRRDLRRCGSRRRCADLREHPQRVGLGVVDMIDDRAHGRWFDLRLLVPLLPRARTIMCLRFEDELMRTEIGKLFGFTDARDVRHPLLPRAARIQWRPLRCKPALATADGGRHLRAATLPPG